MGRKDKKRRSGNGDNSEAPAPSAPAPANTDPGGNGASEGRSPDPPWIVGEPSRDEIMVAWRELEALQAQAYRLRKQYEDKRTELEQQIAVRLHGYTAVVAMTARRMGLPADAVFNLQVMAFQPPGAPMPPAGE